MLLLLNRKIYLNGFGVLDHNVILESGREFYNPMRVLKNDNGSEVIFTLYRQPEMTDIEFQEDADTILKDLCKMKDILENLGPPSSDPKTS